MFLTIDLKVVRRVLAVLLILAVPAALGFAWLQRTDGGQAVAAVAPAKALETGAWGLSFQTPGAAPIGNATSDELAAYDAKFLGNTGQKTIYLTFDCGYENGYTASILDTLKAHHVKAAFFIVGNYIETAPALVQRMVDEGHIVGNHTYHHPDMSKLSSEASFNAELAALEDAYQTLTGQPLSKYYRPPQGVYSEENLNLAKRLGYKTVFWSLAYVDWYQDNQPTEAEAMEKLTSRIHNGAVVLLHSTSVTNSKILDQLLTRWESMGYTFGTLDDLFAA